MNKKRPFFSTSVFTAIGRAGGFLIPFFIASVFGAGHDTDAFFFAYSLIFALSGVFNYVFESVILPYLSEHPPENEQVFRFANTALFFALPILAVIAFLICAGLPYFLTTVSGWAPETALQVKTFFAEMIPMLLLGVWISQANSLFFHRKIFWLGAFSPLIRSLVVIGFLLGFHRHFGVHILSWGFSAGEFVRWIVTIFLLKKETSWRLSLRWQGPAGRILEFFKQTGFQVIALMAVQLIVVVDQWFAAKMGVGSLSYLTYADRLLQVAYILFLSGLAQVFLSYWAESYYREPELFWGQINKDIRGVLKLAVPLTVLMWFLRKPLASIVFHYSKISHDEILKIADIFGWFVVGFVPGLVRLLYGRILLILKKSRFYCFQSWTELILNAFFDYLFGKMFGIAGIAMSTSMVYFISTVWLHFYFKKHQARR